MNAEPVIQVGILERQKRIRGVFLGEFGIRGEGVGDGPFEAVCESGTIVLSLAGRPVAQGADLTLVPLGPGTFLLRDVTIGIHFHWERKEDQQFEGALRLLALADGTMTVMNVIGVEAYLSSVISSEMSATSPVELLRAHAITSRSWLVAMLEREKHEKQGGAARGSATEAELVRWYDREDHATFDVCADDHCQRYQGVSKILAAAAAQAVRDTRGMFLVKDGAVCDARFFKACGGRTEEFQNAWEDTKIDYLKSVSDSPHELAPIVTEADAEGWITASPDAFCNTTDGAVLRQVLPSFDQETTDFFRWKVTYAADELREIIHARSGIDFGRILDLVPLRRGPSGRIIRLRIVGDQRTMVIGKELEIRKWLSKSHLYSSAFLVRRDMSEGGWPVSFTLLGAGWGHGVGLCQIGAAVMATKGYSAEQIVLHYFTGAKVEKLY